MKRTFLLLILLIGVIFASGCETNKVNVNNGITQTNPQTIEEPVTKEKVGSHLLFQTSDKNKYLDFLTNFDETKYEIVHISTFALETSNAWNDDYFMITYKVIAE